MNEKYINPFMDMLNDYHIHYTVGKTWTTDGVYRETAKKVQSRKDMGCISVEMECSAMVAMTQFRKLDFFTFFYAADNLDAENWDARSLSNHSNLDKKDKAAQLALEMALRM